MKLVFYLFYSFSFHFVCSLFILIFFVLLVVVVVAVETQILYKLHFAQQRTWVHVFLCWTQLRIEHVFQFTCARRMTSFLFLHLFFVCVCEPFLCYEKSKKNAFSPYRVSCAVRMRPHLVQFNYLPFSLRFTRIALNSMSHVSPVRIRISAHFYILCIASAEGLLLVLVVFHLMEKSETKHRPFKIYVKLSPSKCRKIRAKDFENSSSALTLSFYCSLFEWQSTS